MHDPTRFIRRPSPVLQPYVKTLWAIEEPEEVPLVSGRREHVLPTGEMHLVFRLDENPLRLFTGATDFTGQLVGDAVVGGARETFYVRDVTRPLCSVGAQLRPGASEVLFGIEASELTGSHTALPDVWGSRARSMPDRLTAITSLAGRVDALEAILVARLPSPRALHPAVAQALRQFTITTSVEHVVRGTGYSHRTLITQFRRAVGLAPKEYLQVMRLQRVLKLLISGEDALADVAIVTGFSDQAHFSRAFRDFAGVPPAAYRRALPRHPHHLSVDAPHA